MVVMVVGMVVKAVVVVAVAVVAVVAVVPPNPNPGTPQAVTFRDGCAQRRPCSASHGWVKGCAVLSDKFVSAIERGCTSEDHKEAVVRRFEKFLPEALLILWTTELSRTVVQVANDILDGDTSKASTSMGRALAAFGKYLDELPSVPRDHSSYTTENRAKKNAGNFGVFSKRAARLLRWMPYDSEGNSTWTDGLAQPDAVLFLGAREAQPRTPRVFCELAEKLRTASASDGSEDSSSDGPEDSSSDGGRTKSKSAEGEPAARNAKKRGKRNQGGARGSPSSPSSSSSSSSDNATQKSRPGGAKVKNTTTTFLKRAEWKLGAKGVNELEAAVLGCTEQVEVALRLMQALAHNLARKTIKEDVPHVLHRDRKNHSWFVRAGASRTPTRALAYSPPCYARKVMVWRQHDLQHINTMAHLLRSIVSDDEARSKLFDRIIIGTKDDEKKRAQFTSTVRRPPRRKLTRRSPPLLARLSAGSPSITLRKKKGSGAGEGHAFTVH